MDRANRVVCFSSQYGSDNSRSYTAGNLAGEANNFPRYGDFTQAFVLRTYGPWWNLCPSSCLPVKKTCTGNMFISEDFVDLQYPHLIYPTKIEILETYNPGSVVRILALQLINSTSKQHRWTILWSGAPQNCPPKARKFSPPLKKTKYPTNLIRLEFNQSHLKYYTELDGVLLSGNHADHESEGASASQISEISDSKTSLTANLFRQLSLSETKNEVHDEPRGNGVFDILPSELIQYMFSYLELIDLIRAAPTCRLFFLHCYDPVWYKELDLRPYWNLINNQALDALRKRCTATEKLDLSWSGPYEAIDASGINRFIECCGSNLVCLRLSCCTFVDNQVIQAVCQWCLNLEELDLQSCDSKHLNDNGLLRLQILKKLKRVNLYRVLVTDQVLQALIQSCGSLQHLNIGGNMFVASCDFVMRLLGHHCSGLVSLDLWRSKSLTAEGIRCLADGCSLLEELDIGWCTNVNAASGCLIYLTSKCRKLKKLFLTAIRSVSDSDVVALADNCPDMQQVDMLGTALVHPDSVVRLLTQCKKLRLLDLSFCSQLTAKIIASLRAMNPNVSIKKSFVTEEQE